jgi:hypothetical protein
MDNYEKLSVFDSKGHQKNALTLIKTLSELVFMVLTTYGYVVRGWGNGRCGYLSH